MKAYFIKTNGSEDNGFQPIVAAYTYHQYIEIIKSLKERNIPYSTWVDDCVSEDYE